MSGAEGPGSGSTAFVPHLDVLPRPQRALWSELAATPSGFVLHGGTAVALHLGHRSSIDFDFFAFRAVDPAEILRSTPYLSGGAVRQMSPNTLSCDVDRGGPVKVSFFGLPHMAAVCRPRIAGDVELAVASLVDLAATKVEVVQRRAEVKDYIDVAAILASGRVDLPNALTAARAMHGSSFTPELSLKALCYFQDGDLGALPKVDRDRLTAAVAAVDLENLPDIAGVKARCEIVS